MKISKLKVDVGLEKDGAWVDYASGARVEDPDTHDRPMIRVRSWSYQPFQTAVLKLARSQRRSVEDLDAETGGRVLSDLVATHILLDLRGFEEDDGKPIENSLIRKKALLNDEALRPFYEAVIQSARDESVFRASIAEDDAGNSPSSSTGSSGSGSTAASTK